MTTVAIMSMSPSFLLCGLFLVFLCTVSSVPLGGDISLRKCARRSENSQGKTCETDSLPQSLLQSPVIRIRLEDGQVVVFRGQSVSNGEGQSNGWTGANDRFHTLSLVTHGSGFHGAFSNDGMYYQILSDANGKQFIMSIPASELPDEAVLEAPAENLGIRQLKKENKLQDGSVELEKNRAIGNNTYIQGSLRGSSVLGSSSSNVEQYHTERSLQSLPDIGIMVLWTRRAECLASGQTYKDCVLTANSEENMRLLIDNAMQQTQTAFVNSIVGATITLVHARRVDYVEVTNDTPTTLSHLRGTTDGYMDEIHDLRSFYGADLVSLIVKSYDVGGLSYASSSNTNPSRVGPAYAFNVVEWIAATSKIAFGHEVAHNLGCHHNEGSTARVGYVDPMPYGYQDPLGRFGDIMASNCPGGCERVPYFSNPDVQYNGMATGNSTTKCAQTITNNPAYYAAFRTAVAE